MRIWHEQLIPNLCVKHFVALWREALGAYKIIAENKKGYRNHPATQEFIECPEQLHDILCLVKEESKKRGYNFKDVPERVVFGGERRPWQTLEEQIEWLKTKGCNCRV